MRYEGSFGFGQWFPASNQLALAIEMKNANLNFERELKMSIYYDEQNIGSCRVDFFVEGKIKVELKAITQLEKVHLAQALNYLEVGVNTLTR